MNEPDRGFSFGDHVFARPEDPEPPDRWGSRRQILGAPPPTYLEGMARDSTIHSPAAKTLRTGVFCGHGESTMTIFDVVIDGIDHLEIGAVEAEDSEARQNVVALVARIPYGDWHYLFRRAWEAAMMMLDGVTQVPVSESDAGTIASYGLSRVAIGFEYPCDAMSRDDVSWIAIDVLRDGDAASTCVVSAELA